MLQASVAHLEAEPKLSLEQPRLGVPVRLHQGEEAVPVLRGEVEALLHLEAERSADLEVE